MIQKQRKSIVFTNENKTKISARKSKNFEFSTYKNESNERTNENGHN